MTFDHLDDPDGFVPDDGFRAAAQRDGRRRRRRRRLALTGGSTVASLLVVVVTLGGYGLWRTSQIDRVPVDFTTEPVDLGEPFNVLLVGTDRRPDGDGPVYTDTLVVARVDPAERQVRLLSLPRDLYLDLASGSPGRLATAFELGGAQGLVSTVEDSLGIPIAGYVAVDFQGFVDLVDEAGGIPLSVSQTLRDQQTGLSLAPTTCAALDGVTALALVRSRHVEVLRADGQWQDEPTADVGRQTRQRVVLAAVASELGEVGSSLGGAKATLDLAASHLTIDDRLDTATLLALGRWFVDGAAPAVEGTMLPVQSLMLGQMLVLDLAPDASEAVAEFGGVLPGHERDRSTGPGGPVLEGEAGLTHLEDPGIGPCR